MELNKQSIYNRRVLVSSITSWSKMVGANTFSTLFEDYPANNLFNIYTRAELPTTKACSRYFRILEGAVVKSIFNKNIKTGCVVEPVENDELCEQAIAERKRYAFFTKHRWHIFLWCRELAWKIGRWKSKELNNFLEEINPEIFVFSIESYWYFNRLNKYIIKKTKPKKVIAYLWDDNFTYKQKPYDLIYYFNRFFTRQQAKELVALCDSILAISPKMKEECDKFFNIESTLLTKPLLCESFDSYNRIKDNPIRIVYSGSMVIGRYKVLALLAECIAAINRGKRKYFLDIYSGTFLSEAQKKRLNNGSSKLNGYIPQDMVFREQQNADILLFVESLNNKTNNIARLSFSTKITDYLSRNRTILAIGPDNIASLEYLRQEDAAIICHNKTDIMHVLQDIIDRPEILSEYASKASECGKRNHSRQDILTRFRNILDY